MNATFVYQIFYKFEMLKIQYFSMIWSKKLNECYFCLPDFFLQIWNMLKIQYFSMIWAKKLNECCLPNFIGD